MQNNPISSVVKAKRIQKPSAVTLPQLPGIQILQQGGPLAPAEIKIRGLSGARIPIDLAGMPINDPVSGLLDVHDLPLFALQLDPHQTGLSFTLPTVKENFATSKTGFGSFSTGKWEFITGFKFTPKTDLLVVSQAGISAGDFSYRPTSIITSDAGPITVRHNNDQTRLMLLARANTQFDFGKSSTLILGNWHEGGIPGLAGTDLHDLRGQHRYFIANQYCQIPIGMWNLSSQLQGRFDHRSTQNNLPNSLSVVDFAQEKLIVEATRFLPAQSSINTKISGELGQLLGTLFSRKTLDFRLSGQTQFTTDSIFELKSHLGFQAFSDVGFLWDANLDLSATLHPFWRLGSRLGKSARAPTFAELYAPSGLVIGNPDLGPESFYETELYTQLQFNKIANLRLAGFYGYIENNILYVNQNAFEIKPINTSGAQRGGFDLTLSLTPYRFVGLDWNAQLIASRLSSTGAPLPGVPLWSSLISLRGGEANNVCGWFNIRYHGDVSSNLFGTLNSPPYWLFDAILKLPLTSLITLHASATNIFNVMTARDSNQLPLPGRAFFISLEVSSSSSQ